MSWPFFLSGGLSQLLKHALVPRPGRAQQGPGGPRVRAGRLHEHVVEQHEKHAEDGCGEHRLGQGVGVQADGTGPGRSVRK